MKHKEDEADSDNDDGYYLRTKRARLEANSEGYVSPYVCKRPYKKRNPLGQLPAEILCKVLTFISFEELGNTFRLVSKKFRTLSQIMMNNALRDIERRLIAYKKITADSIMHSQDDMETRCMCKMLNTVEFLIFHCSIIKSTIWRYTYNHLQASNTCMYAGTILDLFYSILDIYSKDPARIYSPGILSDYAIATDVNRIISLTKTFVLFFDRVTEQNLNTMVLSGCKIVDILDCAAEAKRDIKEKIIVDNTLIYKVSYYFCNSWLVALATRDEKQKPWNEQMRLMYMRIRRIVVSHTEMHMEYEQFRREVDVRPKPSVRLRKPVNSVYTGYGEVGEMFFYYGAMNEGAFNSKFDLSLDLNLYDDDSEEDVSVDLESVPYMGLYIHIDLKCPLSLAPMDIFRQYVHLSADDDPETPIDDKQEGFDLNIEFHCPGAQYARLPTTYSMQINHNR